jgi:hypothetical protein
MLGDVGAGISALIACGNFCRSDFHRQILDETFLLWSRRVAMEKSHEF